MNILKKTFFISALSFLALGQVLYAAPGPRVGQALPRRVLVGAGLVLGALGRASSQANATIGNGGDGIVVRGDAVIPAAFTIPLDIITAMLIFVMGVGIVSCPFICCYLMFYNSKEQEHMKRERQAREQRRQADMEQHFVKDPHGFGWLSR